MTHRHRVGVRKAHARKAFRVFERQPVGAIWLVPERASFDFTLCGPARQDRNRSRGIACQPEHLLP
jgi:hypothetical protein